MANEQNLIPGAHPLSVDEASKGGIASGQARRIKSRKRQLILDLLALRQPDEKIIADLQRYGVDTDDLTNEVVMHLRQIEKAVRKGDTAAYSAVLKAAGVAEENINLNTPRLLVVDAETLQAASKWSSKPNNKED